MYLLIYLLNFHFEYQVHPSHNYFAVGEKGNMPNINIFEWPSLRLYRVLRQGTQKGYAYLDFE